MRWSMALLLLSGVAVGFGAEQLERRRVLQPPAAMSAQALPVDAGTLALVQTLDHKGIRLAQNSGQCKQGAFLGFHAAGSGWIDLCTDAIQQAAPGTAAYKALLQVVLAHEAVHVAQYCRRSRGGPPAVGLPDHELANLSAADKQSVESAVSSGIHRLPYEQAWRQEAEATALERQPATVIALLNSAC